MQEVIRSKEQRARSRRIIVFRFAKRLIVLDAFAIATASVVSFFMVWFLFVI